VHQAVGTELPVLVAVGAVPVVGVVAPLIGEANGDAAVVVGPELFDQAVVQFPVPFSPEELGDGLAPRKELGAISPDVVYGVSQRHPFWVAGVRAVLSALNLLGGGLIVERREGWP
jgi:hypothetical protein